MKKIKRKNMILGIEEIKKYLPHRFPYLMVDRIIEASSRSCVGLKAVSINECFFVGHFPQQAIMPGTLIIECMAQVAAFVGISQNRTENEIDIVQNSGFLVTANIKFQQPVIPGDNLIIKVQIVKSLGAISVFYGEVLVDGEIMAKGEISIVKEEI